MLPLEQNFHYLQIVQLSSVRAFHLHSRLRIDVCELWILINVGTCVQIEQLQFSGKSLNNNNKKSVTVLDQCFPICPETRRRRSTNDGGTNKLRETWQKKKKKKHLKIWARVRQLDSINDKLKCLL